MSMGFFSIKCRFKLLFLISYFLSCIILSTAQTTIINESFSTARGTTPPAGWSNNLIRVMDVP